MNPSISFTDPGAMLGKAILKIGQIIFGILAFFSCCVAYLASEEMFSDWKIQLDSDVAWLFSEVELQTWITYFSIGLAIKFLILLGVLAWLDRKF